MMQTPSLALTILTSNTCKKEPRKTTDVRIIATDIGYVRNPNKTLTKERDKLSWKREKRSHEGE